MLKMNTLSTTLSLNDFSKRKIYYYYYKHEIQDRIYIQYKISMVCNWYVIWQILRIIIPDAMLDKFILWHHQVLSSVGTSRLEDSIKGVHFYHPRLRDWIAVIVGSCEAYQNYKLQGRGVGELELTHGTEQPSI
jgi:hypothetical protein